MKDFRISKRKISVNSSFFKTWSSDMAWILGFIMADGSVINNTLRIKLSIKDVEILEFIKNKIQYIGPIRFGDWKEYPYCELSFMDKEIFNDLNLLGVIERKTGHESWPNIPSEFIPDFIRGYFDGDGCVNKRKKYNSITVSFACASQEFLSHIKNYFSFGKIVKIKNANCFSYLFHHPSEVQEFYRKVYNGGYSLRRKRIVFEDFQPKKIYYSQENKEYLISIYNQYGAKKCSEEAKKLGIPYKRVGDFRRRDKSCQT